MSLARGGSQAGDGDVKLELACDHLAETQKLLHVLQTEECVKPKEC